MIPTEQLRKHLDTALNKGLRGLRLYTANMLGKIEGNHWHIRFRDQLSTGMQKQWDDRVGEGMDPQDAIEFHYLGRFVTRRRNFFDADFGRNVNRLPTWLSEIQDVRNKFAHMQPIEEDEALRALNNLILIFRHLGMTDLEEEIVAIREEIRVAMLPEELKKSLQEKAKSSNKPEYKGPLMPWFKNVMPHLDIQKGILDESVFAANLAEVASGEGREVYRDPDTFFSKTYFTAGLKTIAKRVIKGLNGEEDAENRVISLQTGFGGGKTHSLITLFHLAALGQKAADPAYHTEELLAYAGEPKFSKANVAVFTNATNDPTQGRKVDGLHIHTLWGELAYQLGGREAYEIIRANDESLTAPAGLFRKVLEKTQPALILIDELADYCVKASARIVGGSTLSDQTISFIQELSEAIAGINHCVLVATLPASESEVATSAEGAQILTALSNRLSRVSKDTKPVEDEEIFEVIRRRLFEDLGSEAEIDKVVSHYVRMYQELWNELPGHVGKAPYRDKLKKAYPFHPELIDMFRIRWASHHDFQRTRGVLRLLASIVSDLWKRQGSLAGNTALIHPSDVNFQNLDALTSQLKKLYGNGYDAVIPADVSGGSSNAFKIDTDKKEYGLYNLTQGISSTILMGSFGSTGANKGISVEEIKLCVLRPDSFNHNSVNGALDGLENRAHYLYYTTVGAANKRYWFHTKPNINILINQAKNEEVGMDDVYAEILRRINNKVARVQAFNIIVDPPEDIPEQKQPTLVLLHPKYLVNPKGVNGKVRPVIKQLATKKGNAERIYRNTMLFLLCTEIGFSQLKRDVTEYLACKKVREDYQSQLEPEQRKDLSDKMEESSRLSEKSIVTAYATLVKWRANEPEQLSIRQFKDSLDLQIGLNIQQLLKDEEWLLESVGFRLLERNNLLPTKETPISAKRVYEAFIRFDNFPMIVGPAAVQDSLLRYCYDEEIGIASGDGQEFQKYYLGESVPYFDVADETYWLVEKTTIPKPESTVQEDPQYPEVPESIGIDGNNGEKPAPPLEQVKTFQSITISGRIDVANYHQVFTSFINPLRNNGVEIEIRIKGKTNSAYPLTENSAPYKITKESAKQLGLGFEEE